LATQKNGKLGAEVTLFHSWFHFVLDLNRVGDEVTRTNLYSEF
jgi:hypothetical protein